MGKGPDFGGEQLGDGSEEVLGGAFDIGEGFDEGIDEDFEGGIDPGRVPDNTLIDMVELGGGCGGNCVGCAAFEGMDDVRDRTVSPITPEKLMENLTQEIVDTRTGVKHQLIDLFASFATTGIDMEPLESGIFNEAAEIIYSLSKEREDFSLSKDVSRLVAISHGLRCREVLDEKTGEVVSREPLKEQLVRLKETVKLMLEDKVPLFVLSIDAMREGGFLGPRAKALRDEFQKQEKLFMIIVKNQAKFEQAEEGLIDPVNQESEKKWNERLNEIKERLCYSLSKKVGEGVELSECELVVQRYFDLKNSLREAVEDANASSYAATVMALAPAITAGKRVTLSLQGDNNKESPAYVGLTHSIHQKILNLLVGKYKLGEVGCKALMNKVNVLPPRLYTAGGRAKNVLKISEDRPCDVNPDKDFVRYFCGKDKPVANRGVISSSGVLKIQTMRGGRTYNDTVAANAALANPDSASSKECDNPWRIVDLRGRDFDTMEIVAPDSFLFRVFIDANPRVTEIPSPLEDESEIGLENVYPLSEIEDVREKDLVISEIEKYFGDNGFSFSEIADGVRCQRIIEALIPEDVVVDFFEGDKNFGHLSFEDLRGVLARKFVSLYTIARSNSYSDVERKTMGQILAIQKILKELNVEVKLRGEEEDVFEGVPDEIDKERTLGSEEFEVSEVPE